MPYFPPPSFMRGRLFVPASRIRSEAAPSHTFGMPTLRDAPNGRTGDLALCVTLRQLPLCPRDAGLGRRRTKTNLPPSIRDRAPDARPDDIRIVQEPNCVVGPLRTLTHFCRRIVQSHDASSYRRNKDDREH